MVRTCRLIALAMLTAVAACKESRPAASAAPALPAAAYVEVTPESVAVTGEWLATLDGNVNAQIRPQVSGYLVRRAYREGAAVRKGDVLFEIDRRPFENALAQARAHLAEARSQLAKSDRDLARDRPLAEQRAIAQSQLDTSYLEVLDAETRLLNAQLALVNARLSELTGFVELYRSLGGGWQG